MLIIVTHQFLRRRHQDILIVGAVKHANHSRFGKLAANAPQKMVLEFFFRGGFERRQRHALRVHQPHHMPHNAALTGGIKPLEDDQHGFRAAVIAVSLRKESFLQLGQISCLIFHSFLAVLLTLVPAGSLVTVNGCQIQLSVNGKQFARISCPASLPGRIHRRGTCRHGICSVGALLFLLRTHG